ncbi:VanZ family protein [Cohnella sp. GCM10012308]|uniref:VanZ family protein n=1 Tax=Cohnella sp. GCM10012308 TaxID=3317329 RepID=UPI00360CA9A6
MKKGFIYIIFFSLFYLYLIQSVKYTFFPILYNTDVFGKETFSQMIRQINYNPLSLKLNRENLLNILLTIPFGFGINFVSKMLSKNMLLTSFIVGFSIETIQLIMNIILKISYRTIDINDSIMNLIGVLVGFLAYRIFKNIFVKTVDKLDIEKAGLIQYVYNQK